MNLSDVLYVPDAEFDLNLPVVTKKVVTTSRTEPIQIVFLGDLHLGAAVTDEGFIEKIAERLKRPNTYWVDLGDACEFINMQDKRFNIRDIAEWAISLDGLSDMPLVQMQRYAQIFKPVADKCICRVKGNHEDAIVVKWERDVYHELSKMLGVPKSTYLGYSGFLRLVCQRQAKESTGSSWTLTGYLSHGHGGGKLAGGKALNLERLMMAYEADFYAFGHTHTKIDIQKRVIGTVGRKAQDKLRCAFSVGSCRRGQSSWEKRMGFYPQCCSLLVWSRTCKNHHSVWLE